MKLPHLHRLYKFLSPHKKLFFVSIACMTIFGATDGAVPFLIKKILDGVFTNKDETLLWILPGIIIAFAVIRGLADFAQQYFINSVGHLVIRDLRNAIQAKLLTLSDSFYVRKPSGDLLAMVTSDVANIRTVLTDSAASVLRDSIRVIALLSAALYLDPQLALIGAIAFPLGIYPIIRFGKRIRKLSRHGQDAIGALSSRLQETILGHRVVKMFGRENDEARRFAETNESITNTFIKTERVRASTGPLNEILGSIAIAAVMLYGGYSVISESRTQGDFIAFLISLFLLYDPFKKLSRVHGNIQLGLSSADRIFQLLDTDAAIKEPAHPKMFPASHEVSFDHVHASYDGEALVLKDICLKIPAGKRVALVGFSGAGKSTLVDLLPRFLDPISGKVLIGGVDIATMSLQELRSNIAMVGQHTFLFHDSVLNNIAYGKSGATKEEIVAAAQAAFAHDFIMQLPHGYDTYVGEGGATLSGGERQRISIARALLKNAPLLILDEATASLDNRAEREVQLAIDKLTTSRTSIIIAHRLSTVRSCHEIIVLREGVVIEQGRHEELLSLQGEYARLHALQFADNQEELLN